MKIHEYQARDLFEKAGIPIPRGKVAENLTQAKDAAQYIGYPLVLKAQVLVGGRGKAGGVKVLSSHQSFDKTFNDIQALKIKGYAVERILIVQAVDIKKEFYCSVTVDNANNDVVLIASSAGGVEIEETAKTNPEKIHKFYLNGQKTIDPARWPSFISEVFSDPQAQKKATEFFDKLIATFFKYDCSLVEINPLVINEKGDWIAADAKIIFDDNALMRHPDILTLRDERFEDADEVEAKKHDLSFVKLDGNIGCIVNGAGLAMATTDIIKYFGGDPANFLDVGGSSNPEKVLNALKIILRNPSVKAILINIFGGITRCDDIAKGILAAKSQIDIPVPLVVRLTGTNEKEAKDLLEKENMTIYTSMREAVEQVVKLAK